MLTGSRPQAHYQGYIDERSIWHVKGWLRDTNNPEDRLDYEVVLPQGAHERVLASGRADLFSDVLRQVGVGDGTYGFEVHLPEALSETQRDSLYVRPTHSKHSLELAPALRTAPPEKGGPYQGYVDACSVFHVAGWVRDLSDPQRRVDIEVLRRTATDEIVLAAQSAGKPSDTLRRLNVGDAHYAFFCTFDPPLDETQRDQVFVRVHRSSHELEMAPNLNRTFQPIHSVAMDIVDNCNLRCPFCVEDYRLVHRTNFMSDATFESLLRLLPFVTDGNFWLSAVHEATMHPKLIEFIEKVPLQYRHKLFFTTNLAKRQKPPFFEALAKSGLHNINISFESFKKDVYEKLRQGARQHIFLENLEMLLHAFGNAKKAPLIRYNLMAYRSNLHELPGLVETLLNEKQAWQAEIRATFEVAHIPKEFRDEEFLTTTEWNWLQEALNHFPKDRVLLLLPPQGKGYDEAAPDVAASDIPKGHRLDQQSPVPRPFNLMVRWDGTLRVHSELPAGESRQPQLVDYFVANINELNDPIATFMALP